MNIPEKSVKKYQEILFRTQGIRVTCMDILEKISEELANFFPIGKHAITKGLLDLVVKNAKSIMGESQLEEY